jgi:hypothetical protein
MSVAYPPISTRGASRDDDGVSARRGVADWLSLAAAPTFAVMALLTAALSGGAEPLCSMSEHGSLISGMIPMYLLMSAFHSGPWLRLIVGPRD